MALDTAEKFDVPKLLDAEDMVPTPEQLSLITYVSQIYKTFK